MNTIPLHKLRAGEKATVVSLKATDSMHRRFLDLGLIEGTSITCLMTGAGGTLSAYLIRNAVIAIRKKDADNIEIITE